MNLKRTTFLFAFTAVLGCICYGQTSITYDKKLDELDKLINEQIAVNKIPGISLGIVKDGEIVLSEGYGFVNVENKTPATSESIYQLGSVTKIFTGYLLASLVSQNEIALDEPISGFFPESVRFPKSQNGLDITIQEIATHSSEFPRYPANLKRIDPYPIRGYSLDEMHRGIEMVTINTVSGSRYNYSNFGYGILGVALENHSGKTLSKLMEEFIFTPNRMSQTSLVLNDSIEKELATPYLDNSPLVRTEPWDMGTLSGAGNLFSSVSDLNKLMMRMLEVNDVNKAQQTKYFKINETWWYGLGCFIVDSEKYETQVIYHGGDIDGYASALSVYPEYNFGFVILTNLGEGDAIGETFSLISDFITSNFLLE